MKKYKKSLLKHPGHTNQSAVVSLRGLSIRLVQPKGRDKQDIGHIFFVLQNVITVFAAKEVYNIESYFRNGTKVNGIK